MKTLILQKMYRPFDRDEQLDPGTEVHLSDDEGQRALDNGIALTPEDAAKSVDEVAAVELLTDLGYTVAPPKDRPAPNPSSAPLVPKPIVPTPAPAPDPAKEN